MGFTLILISCDVACNAMLSPKEKINKQTSLSDASEKILSRFDEFNHICKDFSAHSSFEHSIITWQDFFDLLQAVCGIMKNEIYHAHWVADHAQDPMQKLNRKQRHVYAQARVIPSTTKIVVMGDYHGSVHSLIRNIEYIKYDELLQNHCISPFGILDPNVILVFLGDLADYGHYGLETWVLALLLKLKNPHNVFLLRGNHEDDEYITSKNLQEFNRELILKLSPTEFNKTCQAFDEPIKALCDLYVPFLFGYLPQVLFLGTHAEVNDPVSFLMFCHGGLALKSQDVLSDDTTMSPMDFHPLLDQACKQPGKNASCLSKEELYPSGFVWDGFIADDSDFFSIDIDGPHRYGKLIQGSCAMHYLQTLCKKGYYSVAGIIRGHDHFDYGVSMLRNFYSEGIYNDLKFFWKPIDSHSIDCSYDQSLNQFPIFTVTSFAEKTHVDAYALTSFNPKTKTWHISPRVHNVPVHLFERAPIQSINTHWKNKKYTIPLIKKNTTKPVFIPHNFSVNNIDNIVNKERRQFVPVPAAFLLDKSGQLIFSSQWKSALSKRLLEYESSSLSQAETVKCNGIDDSDMIALIGAAQHIKNLYLFETYKELTDCGLGLLSYMQELSYLYIEGGRLTNATLFFLEKAPALKSLVLINGRSISKNALQWLIKSPSLEDFTIRGFDTLSSEAVALLLHMKHIKKITIEACPAVKKIFFHDDKKIALCCPTLEKIVIDGEPIYQKSSTCCLLI